MKDKFLFRKNVLDLQFQKYLTIITLSVMIFFTYLIGIVISVLTKQIVLDDLFAMSFLVVFSLIILGICSIFFFNSLFHIKNIPRVIGDIGKFKY